MGLQKNLGENDSIDSGDRIDDVSYVPEEGEVETPEEKSDAQLVAEGELTLGNEEEEIFVSPNSIYKPPAKEEEETEEEAKEEEEKQEEKQEAPPAEEKKKPAAAPDPVQKRINKITREKYEALRKAEKLEKRLLELEDKFKSIEFEKERATLANQRPNLEDFESDEAYHEALGRWAAKMEIHESKTPAKEEKAPAEEEPVNLVQKAIDIGKETYPDFEELVLREDLQITPTMLEAAIDSDHAAAIFYHLGQHPELATKISQLRSPASVAREIGRIELKFIGEEVEEVYVQTPDKDSETIEKSKVKTKQKISTPPPPVKPLSGGGRTSKGLDDMSLEEYFEARGFDRTGMKKRS